MVQTRVATLSDVDAQGIVKRGVTPGPLPESATLVPGVLNHAVIGLFDDMGNLQKVEYRAISSQTEVENRLREWYGYTSNLVRVKRFCIPPGPIQSRFPPEWAKVGEPEFAIAPFPYDWTECYEDSPDLSDTQTL